MSGRAKRVPRLWCALQGLLPLEACLDAQRAELALPPESQPSTVDSVAQMKTRNHVATRPRKRELPPRGSL